MSTPGPPTPTSLSFSPLFVALGDHVYSPHGTLANGKIGLNALQRRTANLALSTAIPVDPFFSSAGDITMVALNLTVDLMVKTKGRPKQVCGAVRCGGVGCTRCGGVWRGIVWCDVA